MQIDIVVAFFMLGFIARVLKTPIEFPEGLYKGIILFLLLAIGLKGGIALNEYSTPNLLPQSLAVLSIGLILPLIAFPILAKVGGFGRDDAASVAAHYGSVSIGTYAVAVSFLESSGAYYEPYFPLFVAILEIPAIAVGVWLAMRDGVAIQTKKILREVFLNQGVLLLVGGLLIGWWAGDARSASVMPLFAGMFQGTLALFLLYMGLVAADKISLLRQHGNFIASFAVVMPLVGASLGALVGHYIGLSQGGTVLLATLGASASYIAVPAAMAVAIPNANQSLSITASLAVTFPFNVLVGIPLYAALVAWFYA
tara:strand:- start:73654 stop:74589 length:936 start_codon:yes stop_codon:yes gene_type:complete